MTLWLKAWTPEDVAEAKDQPRAFAEYCHQVIGVPFPGVKDMTILRRRCNEFFAANRGASWYTLCRVAQWCRSHKRRPPRAWMVVDEFRFAWRDGYLPEFDPTGTDPGVEKEIARILKSETRDGWRQRLICAQGVEARGKAVREWHEERQSRSIIPMEVRPAVQRSFEPISG